MHTIDYEIFKTRESENRAWEFQGIVCTSRCMDMLYLMISKKASASFSNLLNDPGGFFEIIKYERSVHQLVEIMC